MKRALVPGAGGEVCFRRGVRAAKCMDAPIERRLTARKPSFRRLRRSPSVRKRRGVVRRPVSPRNDEINSVGSAVEATDKGEGGRLDKDPPCLVRAASFRT